MAASSEPSLDERLIDVIDAALVLHKKRASIFAINTFVQHLAGKTFDVEVARRLSALNPRDYVLSWEADGSSFPGIGEDMGVVVSGGVTFILELKARGKRETRLNKAKAALLSAVNVVADLPDLPTLEGRSIIPERSPVIQDDTFRLQIFTQESSATTTTTSNSNAVNPTNTYQNGASLAATSMNERSASPEDNTSIAKKSKLINEMGGQTETLDEFHPDEILSKLKVEPYYENQCCFERRLSARPPNTVGFNDDKLKFLSQRVKHMLINQWGISKLYAHQVEAVRASLDNEHVLLLTGTGSGKTLCFASVVAEQVARSRGLASCTADTGGGFLLPDQNSQRFRAIFLYPTKALAQDQLRALRELFARENLTICAIDGDSVPSERQTARSEADVILTNPDFMHCTILPKAHSEWRHFMKDVRLLVIDEAHTYNGAFGCHFAFVLRRLFRLCDIIPSIFMCSATIGNPQQTFERLTGLMPGEVTFGFGRRLQENMTGARSLLTRNSSLISANSLHEVPDDSSATLAVNQAASDGGSEQSKGFEPAVADEGMRQGLERNLTIIDIDCSPQGERLVALWRPKVLRVLPDGREKRASAIFEVARVFASLIKLEVRTLAFCRTRKLVELVLKYCYDLLKTDDDIETMRIRSRVLAYRAGYTKEERREIERKMFSGELIGICCTSALELGIDIGSCDGVLVLGVQGASSTMQMFGRAGRKGRSALNICIMFDGALDRALIQHPQSFLERTAEESAVFDIRNEVILKKHLMCAAKENPLDFTSGSIIDAALFDESLALDYIGAMIEDDLLVSEHSRIYRIKDKVSKPHDFSLRMIEGHTIRLVDDETKRTLDEIEYFRAFFELYPGAIYLHQSRTYCVTHVDLTINREARARRAQVDYYTSPMDDLQIKILKIFETKTESGQAMTGVVRISRTLTGFRKRRFNLEDAWAEANKQRDEKERFQVFLPPLEYSTRATWLDLGGEDAGFTWGPEDEEAFRWGAGIHAVQHLLCRAMRSLILTHHSSIATTHRGYPIPNRLIIFDHDPGGIGIADAVFTRLYDCFELAREILVACPCDNGCEDCIYETTCSEFNLKCLKKEAHIVLARAFVVLGNKSKGETSKSRMFTTPRKLRRAKNLARERAAGTTVTALWKRHLPELGSEHVDFDREM